MLDSVPTSTSLVYRPHSASQVTRITAPAVEVGSVAAPSPPPPRSRCRPLRRVHPQSRAGRSSSLNPQPMTTRRSSAGLVTAGISIILAIICGPPFASPLHAPRKRTNTNGQGTNGLSR